MATLDEVFNDGSGLKDLKEFERHQEDLQKLKRLGCIKKGRTKVPKEKHSE